MKLRHKYLAVMAMPVIVLAAATLLAYEADRRAAEGAAALAHTSAVRFEVRDVLDDLVDSETGTRGLMLTGDAEFLEPYRRGAGALPTDLTELHEMLIGSPPQLQRLDELSPLVTERMSILRRQQELGAVKTPAERALARPLLQRGGDLMTQIRDVLGEMRNYEEARLEALQDQMQEADRRSHALQFVALPLGVLLSLLLVTAMSDRVVRRIVRIEENAMRLERGDPPLEADTSKDEVGKLGRQLTEMATGLIRAQEELRLLATTDPLTGVANRRGFLLIAEPQLELARRTGQSITTAFIDVDGLKMVNDGLGHDQGDLLLQEVAALIRDTLRSADLVARVGGDEFCVLLVTDPERDPDDAVARIARTVAWANDLPGRNYPISVSIGTACMDAAGRETIGDLMRRADLAMYERKRMKATATLGGRTA